MTNVSSDAIARGALGPPKRTAGNGGFRSPAVSQPVRCATGASAGDSARLRAALSSASVAHDEVPKVRILHF